MCENKNKWITKKNKKKKKKKKKKKGAYFILFYLFFNFSLDLRYNLLPNIPNSLTEFLPFGG